MSGSSFASVQMSGSLYSTFKSAWVPSATFIETADGALWTYADLDRITSSFSKRLRMAGMDQGTRLVSLTDRSPYNFFLYLSCIRAGIIFVPLNPKLTCTELAPILADVEPALVVCASTALGLAEISLNGSPTPALTLDSDGSGSFLKLPEGDFTADADVKQDAAAAIIFTSGTTGRPKGAVMPHRLFLTKAQALSQALNYKPSDKLLHTMPLYHAHGLFMTTHCVLSVGASILLLPRFDAAEVVERLSSVTVFSGVPTMYKRMLAVPYLKDRSASMRLFVSASAPLPTDVFAEFAERSGHRIIECWGMSETMTNTASPLSGERRPGSPGKPIPGVEVRAVDHAGNTLSYGKQGVLQVRSAARFNGYWRRPETEQARFHDGYFVTGDIGFLDLDGYLTIVGRTSDVVISGGYNLFPREIELALEQLEGVSKAAVFGLPHPDFGEAVAAAIEPAPGCNLDERDLLARLKLRLASYKVPKVLFIVESLPLTELGKIQRRELADRYNHHFHRG
ncbi:MAG: AMP-binding enzyme family protein [Herminiimonas sp.]|nr:AMP-binding enzyme family protein [Herminiimonas sp.]